MEFDYDRLRKSWKWEVPEYYNIGKDCTDKLALLPSHREKVALYWESDEGECRTYTFADLSVLTNKIANALLSLGFNKGERIVIRLPNLPEFPLVFLGAAKIGAVPVPTSSMLTEEEVGFVLSDSGAKGVVTTPELYGAVEPNRGASGQLEHVLIVGGPVPLGCVDLKELIMKTPDSLNVPETKADDPAYMCYTSGTTGYPRGVVHAHRALIGRDPSAKFWQALRPDDTVMHAGKLNWTYALGTGCLDPWRRGCATVIWGGEHDPWKFLEMIKKYGVNVFMAVPGVYRQMLRAAGTAPFDLSGLRHALSAGEHLSEELFLSWKERFGVELYDGLGMSEFSYYISNMAGMPIKPGSPGKPQPGHQSTLIDEDCVEVPPGEVGVLATPAGDPGIMLGYWSQPEQTAESFREGWFISGDYFYRDEEGYYWLMGRHDDMINTFGYRVSPFEVERVISEHPAVGECAVAGITVDKDKTVTAVFVVLDAGQGDKEEARKSIIEYSKSRLADYKCPREVYFVESVPKTPNGKIMRAVLREEYSNAEPNL